MATEFSHDEVIRRTARRLGINDHRVNEMLDTYADEYVKLARETDPALIQPIPPVKVESKAPAKPARKATTPRKSRAKATAPTEKPDGSQAVSEGSTEQTETTAETTAETPANA